MFNNFDQGSIWTGQKCFHVKPMGELGEINSRLQYIKTYDWESAAEKCEKQNITLATLTNSEDFLMLDTPYIPARATKR